VEANERPATAGLSYKPNGAALDLLRAILHRTEADLMVARGFVVALPHASDLRL
jgi:hypothetical protein